MGNALCPVIMSTISLTDCDALAMEIGEGDVLAIAHALNVSMAHDTAAQKRYARIYGVQWTPVPAIGGEQYFPATVKTSLVARARAWFVARRAAKRVSANTVFAKGTR